jgi:aminopeptidase
MKDLRFTKLAKNLINYSCNLKEGEKVLIEGIGDCVPLVKELVKETYNAKAIPLVTLKNKEVD